MAGIIRIYAAVLFLIFLTNACAPAAQASTPAAKLGSSADLSGIKAYLLDHARDLQSTGSHIQQQANQYYDLAKAADFDYATLWHDREADVKTIILETRRLFIQSNPQYEEMEGIVAGTPSLNKYDVILDSGVSGSEGGDNVVPFDLTLPDGRVLPKPGHLFLVLESALWSTDPAFIVPNLHADLNGNGQIDLSDTLPDANVLKAAVDAFVRYTNDLYHDAEAWQPTESEAFGALITNVPTFSDFIESWKNSRFVMGNQSTEREFVSTSRLSDLADNVKSWQTIYAGLSPLVKTVDVSADSQIIASLQDLHDYVAGLYDQEQAGKHFTAEEADSFSAEGQERATAIAGEISQVAAQLGVAVETP